MTDDAGCIFCGDVQETYLHVLRDCRVAAEAWMKILSVDGVPSFFGMDMNEWVSLLTSEVSFRWEIGRLLGVFCEIPLEIGLKGFKGLSGGDLQ